MFIERLTVKDFQGIREIDIEPGPVTVLYGPTGAAKSSLIDAIQYALTGEPPRGQVLPDVIRRGAASMRIDAIIRHRDARLTVTRTRTRSGGKEAVDRKTLATGNAARMIEQTTGISPALAVAALRSGDLLRFKAPDLQAILTVLSGAKFDPATIAAELGPDVAAAAKRADLKLPGALDGFADAFRKAEAARVAAKRLRDAAAEDLARVEPPPEDAVPHAAAAITAADGDHAAARARVVAGLGKLRATRDEVMRASAQDRGARLAELNAVVAAGEVAPDPGAAGRYLAANDVIEERRRSIATDAQSLADLDAKAAGLRETIGTTDEAADDALAGSATALAAGLADLDAEIAHQQAALDDARRQHGARQKALATLGQPCSGRPCPTYPDTTCPLAPAHFAALTDAVRAALATGEAEGKRLAADIKALHGRREKQIARQDEAKAAQARGAARTALEGIEARRAPLAQRLEAQRAQQTADEAALAPLREAANRAHNAVKARDAVAAARTEIERLESAPAPDVAAMDARLASGDRVLTAIDLAGRRAECEHRIAGAEQSVVDADAVAQACGPKGARARLLGRAAGPFLAAANAALDRFSSDYRIGLDTDGDVAFRVWRRVADGNVELSLPELSDGERQRIQYPLQYAVARLSGAGIVALDRTELVTDEARRSLVALARVWVAEGMQVWLLNSRPAPASVPEGFVAYRVADGRALRIGD